jgi:hypothetical protein
MAGVQDGEDQIEDDVDEDKYREDRGNQCNRTYK